MISVSESCVLCESCDLQVSHVTSVVSHVTSVVSHVPSVVSHVTSASESCDLQVSHVTSANDSIMARGAFGLP